LANLARVADLVAPDVQREAALGSITSAERELELTNAQIKEQRSRLYAASDELGRMEKRIVTQERTVPYQGSVDHLYTLITELRNKRTEMLTKFNANDRIIQELDEKIATTERDMNGAIERSAREQSTDLNPAWQSLQDQMQTATLALAGLDAKQRALQEQVTVHRSRVLQLAEAQPQFEQRLRAVNDARAKYELYSKREDEARVAEALDRQKISNVVLAEAPVPAREPTGPNRRLALLVGSVGGTLIAFGVAVIDDRRRYRGPFVARQAAGGRGVVVVPEPERIARAQTDLGRELTV
jgi:uncharacterized protein involved in exopolysaccharide biosynthesis